MTLLHDGLSLSAVSWAPCSGSVVCGVWCAVTARVVVVLFVFWEAAPRRSPIARFCVGMPGTNSWKFPVCNMFLNISDSGQSVMPFSASCLNNGGVATNSWYVRGRDDLVFESCTLRQEQQQLGKTGDMKLKLK